ncbi:hypothetical protein UT4_00760 [Ferrigenium sp. UT4]
MSIKRKLIYVMVLICTTAMLYGQFLWNPIVFDDSPFFMVNASGHQPVDDYRYSPLELRSLPYATLAWGKAAFGLDMLHFRIENLLLHAAVAVVLFFFLSRVFGAVGGSDCACGVGASDPYSHGLPLAGVSPTRPVESHGAVGLKPDLQTASKLSPDTLAFCAALLFALHPVAVYAAGYLVQRTILMATLFSLLAMLAWLHGDERESKPWLWASAFFYYLAVFSKEHAIMLPAVLLALTVMLHSDWKEKFQRNWTVLLAMCGVALFVLFSKIGILGSVYEPGAPEMLAEPESNLNYPLSVLTQTWLFFKYAALWLFPNPHWMSVDMREPFATSLWSGYLAAFFAFLAWGALAGWLLFKRGRLGLLGFALSFPWLMFLPEFSTVRIQESFVLYRSYLWAAGACAVLPLLLDRLDKHMAGVVIAAIALAMIPISMDRLATFSHPLTLWDDAAKLLKQDAPLPGSARIYNNRGLERLELNQFTDARSDFEMAIRLNPNSPFAYTNLGALYLKVGQPEEAIRAFDMAIKIMQSSGRNLDSRPFLGKGKAYEAMGEMTAARRHYEMSCKIANKGCDKLVD